MSVIQIKSDMDFGDKIIRIFINGKYKKPLMENIQIASLNLEMFQMKMNAWLLLLILVMI